MQILYGASEIFTHFRCLISMRSLFNQTNIYILLFLLALIVMPSDVHSAPKQAKSKVFFYPKYQNYHLDWCYEWGKSCGKTTAFVYCKNQGYRGVQDYKIAHDIGLTIVMSTRQICRYPHCDGFSWIRCYS